MINWDERINYAPKLGERFVYLGKVMEAQTGINPGRCDGCVFNPLLHDPTYECHQAPDCLTHDVIFVEVKEQK